MGVGGCGENLPPRTLARVARDVRDLVKSPPEGVRLVVDEETGMPGSLAEIVVRYYCYDELYCFLLIFFFFR